MYDYSYENLKRITETERGKELVKDYERVYKENYASTPIPVINYSYIKLYYQNGDRNKHQFIYFERRKRLGLLQVLAIADDKWLDPLEEVLAAICDEFTWVLPAHNLLKDKTFNYSRIDLFAAETGLQLSETVYILKDKLSADIQKRIKISLEEKLIKNYESASQGFDRMTNNWSAVCGGSMGLTYLYAFPERFPLVKDRLFATLECFLSGIHENGYCEEGPGYWLYGFGFFCVFFDVYKQLTDEWHPMLDRPKVKNTLQYLYNTNMGGNLFLPFADGGNADLYIDPVYLYAMKNLFGDECKLPACKVEPLDMSSIAGRALGVRALNGVDRFAGEQREWNDKRTVYYDESQVYIYKNGDYAFAAKGGNNAEIHNHNDVGVFQIVKNKKRLLADLGSGEYTIRYFRSLSDGDEGRYGSKVFVCNSLSHSVPIIDGLQQKFGSKEYRGEVLKQTDTCFALDISKAYGLELGTVAVTYQMKENSVQATYACKGIKEGVTFRFISVIEPQIKDGKAVIDELTITNNRNVVPTYVRAEYNNNLGETVCAYLIDYKVENEEAFEMDFTFNL